MWVTEPHGPGWGVHHVLLNADNRPPGCGIHIWPQTVASTADPRPWRPQLTPGRGVHSWPQTVASTADPRPSHPHLTPGCGVHSRPQTVASTSDPRPWRLHYIRKMKTPWAVLLITYTEGRPEFYPKFRIHSVYVKEEPQIATKEKRRSSNVSWGSPRKNRASTSGQT